MKIIHQIIAFCLGMVVYLILNYFNVPLPVILITAFILGIIYGRWVNPKRVIK